MGSTLHSDRPNRILVIEEESSAMPPLWDALLGSEHEVLITGADSLRSHIRDFAPRLVIINSDDRRFSNVELCRKVRRYKESAHTPILLLSERAEDHVGCLDAGADDCVAKPFSVPEFLLRIRGLLRRAHATRPVTLRGADILLDPDRFRVTRGGRDVELYLIEFRLLEFLMRAPGRPFSRGELLAGVWGQGSSIDGRTIDVYIGRLRKALKVGRRTDPIRTVPKVGYSFDDGTCQSTKSLRSSPLRGVVSREACNKPIG